MKNDVFLYLSEIYVGVKSPQSFSGVNAIWKRIQSEKNPFQITKNELVKFLQSFPSFTIHQRVYQNFKRDKFVIMHYNINFEMDLIDMTTYSNYNKNYNYILMLTELLSRKLYTAPLKSKTSLEIVNSLEIILSKNNLQIKILYLDKAMEFQSEIFLSFAKKNKIRLYYSHQRHHATYVERLNQTFQRMIFRYFTQNQTLNYISNLHQFTENYNNRYHTSIGTTPASVNHSNSYQIYLYSNRKYFAEAYLKTLKEFELMRKSKKKKKPEYKPSHSLSIGDKVRLLNHATPFTKHYHGNFSTEIFTIYSIKKGVVDKFLVKDQNGFKIAGYLFLQELKKVNPHLKYYLDPIRPQDKGHIALILDRRYKAGKQYYLASIHFESGKKQEIWINASDLLSY